MASSFQLFLASFFLLYQRILNKWQNLLTLEVLQKAEMIQQQNLLQQLLRTYEWRDALASQFEGVGYREKYNRNKKKP